MLESIVVTGLSLSAYYCIISVGLALAFGVMRIMNFTHGEFYMLGAYMMWIFYTKAHFPIILVLLIGMLVPAALAILVERCVFRPLRGDPMSSFIAATGVAFIIQVLVGQIWGLGKDKSIIPYSRRSLDILGVQISMTHVCVIVASVVLTSTLLIFMRHSKSGQALRACSQDPEAAALQGISINKVAAITMGVAGSLAGAAGVLMAPISLVNPYMGGNVILMAFAVIIVGGAGSIEGAILSSIILGFLTSTITILVDSTIAQLAVFVFMFVILSIKPMGLFSRA